MKKKRGHPFLRTCAFLYGLGNFALPGILLVIVVAGREQGLSGGASGTLLAAFGICLLAGSLLSPIARRRLSKRTILWIELVAWMGSAAFLVRPSVFVLAFFFSSRRRHTRWTGDWSSDVCSSD